MIVYQRRTGSSPCIWRRANLGAYCAITRGVQYVMKTAQYIPKFYIYTLRNNFNLKVCFLNKYM